MSKLNVTFPPKTYKFVLPTLQAPFKIRPVEKKDLPHCMRLVGHAGLYNNPLEIPLGKTDSQGEAYAKVIAERCMQDKLSFVIVNEDEPLVEDEQVKKMLEEDKLFGSEPMLTTNTRDHAASLAKLSPHYVGCIFGYDCAVAFPYHLFPQTWEYFALYTALFSDDLRKNPDHPYHQQYLKETARINARKETVGWKEGDQCNMDIYLDDQCAYVSELAVADQYLNKGFGKALCQAFLDTAFASGFTLAMVSCTHEAAVKIWKELGAIECYRGYPNKLSKIENGVELSRWTKLDLQVPLYMLYKDTSA